MKKVLGVLVALLMATPAMAAVNMTVVDAGGGWAEISYNATGEPNLPRAFALKVEVDTGTMDAVQFAAGTGDEACATCEDFKIHPGNIQIDGEGNVVSWGRPVAPGNAPDNPPQLDDPAGYIIIEMGSLYHKGVDPAPAPSGLLIRVHVTANCTMTVSEEETVRGGVVLEDPTIDPTVNGDSELIIVDCYTGPDYDAWVAVGKPDCWCADSQCHGDADDAEEGSAKTGYFRMWSNDYNVLVGGWKKSDTVVAATQVSCTDRYGNVKLVDAICADFDHCIEGSAKTGYFRLWSNDYNTLVYYWKDAHVAPADCQTATPEDPFPEGTADCTSWNP